MLRILLFFTATLSLFSDERPNILWLTSEDNDKQWLGCYGNKQAHTPNIDSLAERSVRFENFYSNAPVCAVARSTILNGIYAPSQGTQHMRSRHPIPASYKPYVHYLKKAGYYCTNAYKTDYNFLGNDRAIWDECGGNAHYKNRKEGQPFFAVFNFTESHESSLFAGTIKGRRKSGAIPQSPRISLDEVNVPPYLPDLPEVRHDIAVYHDNLTLMDQRVGEVLVRLSKDGLADDTIVFYYADHGGIIPRGKRYLKDTGVNVPLLVHVPEKWKHLTPFEAGSVTAETAAFVDLAPTLLSLLGMEKPAQMQGRAFLGEHREEPSDDQYVFLFADRFDEIYGMRRGLTDGRWKYIRRFTPHYAAAPYSYYQFGQKAWTAWQAAWKEGKLEPIHARIWEKNQAVEELFDTHADRWETVNLAQDPAHLGQLEKMRKALKEKMVAVRDTGLIPEPMFAELSPKKPVAEVAQSHPNWRELVDFVFTATGNDRGISSGVLKKLSSKDPLERYWAVQGCLIRLSGEKEKQAEDLLPQPTETVEKAMHTLLSDPHSAIRAAAAQTLLEIKDSEKAVAILVQELSANHNPYGQQNAVNIFTHLDALSLIPDSWVEANQPKPKGRPNYVQRLAAKLAQERKE